MLTLCDLEQRPGGDDGYTQCKGFGEVPSHCCRQACPCPLAHLSLSCLWDYGDDGTEPLESPMPFQMCLSPTASKHPLHRAQEGLKTWKGILCGQSNRLQHYQVYSGTRRESPSTLHQRELVPVYIGSRQVISPPTLAQGMQVSTYTKQEREAQ